MSLPPPPFRQRKSVMELLESLRPDPHYPLAAMIEVADRCNEACVHCYQAHGEKGELTTEEWKRILDELADMGVFLLTISGGEATLRKDLFELIEHARARSFAVNLYTNGITITREVAARLAALGVMEVQISLYSHEPAVHDGVTQVPGSFERSVAAARHLRDHGVGVVLKSPLMSMNADAVDEYVDFVQGLGVDYQLDPGFVEPRENGDATPEQYRMDDAHFVSVQRHPRLAGSSLARESFTRPLDKSVCGACSGGVHIEANGEMRPCTMLQVPVGHAVRDGVREAWEHDPAATDIRATTWADLPGCRDCDLRHACTRCFATARVEAANALLPYRTACRAARLNHEGVTGVSPEIRAGERDDTSIGPYRLVSDGLYETIEVRWTDADQARTDRGGWIRPPDALVQLRRRTKPAEDPVATGGTGLNSKGAPVP